MKQNEGKEKENSPELAHKWLVTASCFLFRGLEVSLSFLKQLEVGFMEFQTWIY